MNRATEILSHILEPKFSFFHRNLLEEVERESKSRSVVSNSVTPVDCSLLGSSVHGILQARILELVAISFSKGWYRRDHKH